MSGWKAESRKINLMLDEEDAKNLLVVLMLAAYIDERVASNSYFTAFAEQLKKAL